MGPLSSQSYASLEATASRDAVHGLLTADDPVAWRREDYGSQFPALVVCDHASNAVPARLEALGLNADALHRHIAWDLGAGQLAQRLARRLRVPLVMAGYSRLVIDCNRHPDEPGSILAVSDAERVPGNLALGAAERKARREEIFDPYHAAIGQALQQLTEDVPAPALIAVHSFTPVMRGVRRPWHCGILWDRDDRMPLPLLEALRGEPGLEVGDNEPYSGRDPSDYTISVHAERQGWPHVCIEVRQDLLATSAGIEQWSERLAAPLAAILANKKLYGVLTD